ncbi:MAG: UDP-2,4-diacetamido-2,4,6-trideoxy-beta-L-altropyranose hydrolase [Bacteroidetes bacterium]|jgi:UDP-2,4-diacetamido-2,4,6-trideoxy-beta-L-altropyranose hydrolase|nr:UDP-2,4-diacetamido-2,4,6-trideoxy-beta-L-altropyranose hydrolase [Bacteroidota bacterium]
MKSDLFIRTDGSAEIGLGHLVRCMSLSSILGKQFKITFFCREIPEQIEFELKQHGILLKRISQESSFFDQLTEQSTVVLDGYSFDSDYQIKVYQKAGAVACIDDLYDRDFYADLIINHAPGISKEQYSAQPHTKFALGLEYVLLRPPFLKAASQLDETGKMKTDRLLICFGGSDSKNLTLRALNVVSDFNQFKKIIIITGSAYRFKNELLRKIKNDTNVDYYHALNAEEMARAFLRSDIAIVPSSGILFEALATGNIAISGTYTDNQKDVYSGFKKLNAIVDAGEFSKQQISEAIQDIENHKNKNKLIDGKSPERLRRIFQTIKRD